VGSERGPFGFVTTVEELLGRKSSGFSLESREYESKDPQKLALTLPTRGGLSVGVVSSQTQATEFLV
jgi:hypothetical protein